VKPVYCTTNKTKTQLPRCQLTKLHIILRCHKKLHNWQNLNFLSAHIILVHFLLNFLVDFK